MSFEGEGTALYDFVGASAVPADERPMRDQASSRLERAHPNPLNPATTIPYVLAAPGLVELRLYDVQGRLVRRLTGGRQPAGAHEIVWDGRDETGSQLASGQYFATLTVNGKVVDTSRAVILK